MPDTPYLISFHRSGKPQEGYISSTQYADMVPFAIKRVFWTYDTPTEIVRGRHAHKATQQVLVALAGRIKVELDAGKGSKEMYELCDPVTGLFLPQMHWANIHFSAGAILLSMASSDFEELDYIRDYEAFLEAVKQSKSSQT
ncbi:sugar 3,4-ketoisomerase [Pontibacter sp. MBLB2868]|uniref:sugar 3,4-ketoisomerase n=1 Tax=Pontibacter sp. MBLB2868 TaxID=3451555 RepID=UPI003F754100